MNSLKIFEETEISGRLLDEFKSLSSKRRDPLHDFFNKDFLTFAEFLAPIGNEIFQLRPKKKPSNLETFNFDKPMGAIESPDVWADAEEIGFPVSVNKQETIFQFLSRI